MHLPKAFVITGGPSCGKTSVINELERRGFAVVPEAAKKIIEHRLKQGEEAEAIFSDQPLLDTQILQLNGMQHEAIDPSIPIGLDRGMPDSLGYCSHFESDNPDHIKFVHGKVEAFQYGAVFLLEQLVFQKTAFRLEEDDGTPEALSASIHTSYTKLGHDVDVISKNLSITERTDLILEMCDSKGIL